MPLVAPQLPDYKQLCAWGFPVEADVWVARDAAKQPVLPKRPENSTGWQKPGEASPLRDALALAQARKLGLGMVLGQGFFALDFDHCLDKNRKLKPKHPCAQIVAMCLRSGAYIEVSPSGEGLKAFFRCIAQPPKFRSANYGVQLLSTTNYSTVTGDVWKECKTYSVCEPSDELDRTLDLIAAEAAKERNRRNSQLEEPKPEEYDFMMPANELAKLKAAVDAMFKMAPGQVYSRTEMMLAKASYLLGKGWRIGQIWKLYLDSPFFEDFCRSHRNTAGEDWRDWAWKYGMAGNKGGPKPPEKPTAAELPPVDDEDEPRGEFKEDWEDADIRKPSGGAKADAGGGGGTDAPGDDGEASPGDSGDAWPREVDWRAGYEHVACAEAREHIAAFPVDRQGGLYRWGDQLLRIVRKDASTQQVGRPPLVLRPVDPAELPERLGVLVRFRKQVEKGTSLSSLPAQWVKGFYLGCIAAGSPVPRVRDLLYRPIRLADGRVLPNNGRVGDGYMALPSVKPFEPMEPKEALALLLKPLGGFVFETDGDRDAALAAMLTVLLYPQLPRARMIVVTADAPGGGKTTFCTMLAMLLADSHPSANTLDVPAEYGEQRVTEWALAEALDSSEDKVILVDNQPDGLVLHSGKLASLLTGGEVSLDRKQNGKAKYQLDRPLLINGNKLGLSGELAQRSLLVRLRKVDKARKGDMALFRWVSENRHRLACAALSMAAVDVSQVPASGISGEEPGGRWRAWYEACQAPLAALGYGKAGEPLRQFQDEADPQDDGMAGYWEAVAAMGEFNGPTLLGYSMHGDALMLGDADASPEAARAFEARKAVARAVHQAAQGVRLPPRKPEDTHGVRFGVWLRQRRLTPYGGFRLEPVMSSDPKRKGQQKRSMNLPVWRVVKIEE